MKKKEFIYHNTDGKIAKEKLMLMFNENGHVRIDEADYTALYKNIEEFYHWALQGKEIYKRMDELSKNMGFEVRYFYKCEEEADISKFDGKKEIILSKGCFCYI